VATPGPADRDPGVIRSTMVDATDQPVHQLLCDEGSLSPVTVPAGRRSFDDPALRDDRRVLSLMLRTEDSQPPATSGHLVYSQGDLQPSMRRVVVTWMLEVASLASYNVILFGPRTCQAPVNV